MNNKNNKTIMAFILGMLSYMLLIPVIEELANVLLSWLEYFKILPSKLVLKGNKELKELQEEDGIESETYAIVFQYNQKEDFDDEYEDVVTITLLSRKNKYMITEPNTPLNDVRHVGSFLVVIFRMKGKFSYGSI